MCKRILTILAYIFSFAFVYLLGSDHFERTDKRNVCCAHATVSVRHIVIHKAAAPHLERTRYIKIRYMKGDVPYDLSTVVLNQKTPIFNVSHILSGYVAFSYSPQLILTTALRGPPCLNSINQA